MSNLKQATFDDRVYDFIESVTGMSFIAKYAEKLYEAKEYEKLERFMCEVEGQLAIEHFYNSDQIPEREIPDVY